MDRSTHQIRCEQWTQIISECLSSEMSKTAWCKANGISDKAFFYWQRILRNEAYIEQKKLAEVSEQRSDPPVAFVGLKPSEISTGEPAGFHPDVIIRNKGIILESSNTVSPELLKLLGGLLHAQ